MKRPKVKYVIKRLILGSPVEIRLKKRDYDRIATAKRGLCCALDIEERFDVFMANFEELEFDILRIANRNMIYSELSWENMTSARSLLNRRLLNFFASARACVDHTKSDFGRIFGKCSARCQRLKVFYTAAYDNFLAYRAMDALRNYAQHSSTVVEGLSYPTKRDVETGAVSHAVDFSLSIADLETNKHIKKSIVHELKGIDEDNVSLRPLIRDYVEAMGHIQGEVRGVLAKSVERWAELEKRCVDQWIGLYGDETVGLALVAVRLRDDLPNGLIEEFHLSAKVVNRRQELCSRNRKILNCKNQQVASVTRQQPKKRKRVGSHY
jgi:hypothetical protein